MIVRARVVVTMDGPPIQNGAVQVHGPEIVQVGKFAELAATSDDVVDLGEHILLPGLINAHCHLDYTCLRGRIPPCQSFSTWIRAINAEKAKLSAPAYLASIHAGFAEARKFGTTTIANLTAVPELIGQIHDPTRTWWFAELIDVRKGTENLTALSSQVSSRNEMVHRAVENLKSAKNKGLAPHAPFTASADLYRYCQEIGAEQNILLTTHVGESREEMQMFRDASGPLYDFLKEIGRDMTDCGATTPLEAFVRNLDVPQRNPLTSLGMTRPWIIAHLNELTERDFDLLGRIPQKFTIVHCPRSHAYFGHSKFEFEALQELGLNISLGTDSLASNEDLSLFAEMRIFCERFRQKPEKTLEMVTTNAARALGMENSLGKLKTTFLADMIALPFIESGDPHETILKFDAKVPWIMLNGKTA